MGTSLLTFGPNEHIVGGPSTYGTIGMSSDTWYSLIIIETFKNWSTFLKLLTYYNSGFYNDSHAVHWAPNNIIKIY